jgi:hypothetical protein
LEHLPPRALVIERRQQASLLTGIHPRGIGRKGSEIQRESSSTMKSSLSASVC